MKRDTLVHLLTVVGFVLTFTRISTAVETTEEYREVVTSVEGRIKAIETAQRTGECAKGVLSAHCRSRSL